MCMNLFALKRRASPKAAPRKMEPSEAPAPLVATAWRSQIAASAEVANSDGGRMFRPPRQYCINALRADRLDDVDLCRQVARDLEANFLLTHCGLHPNLHDFLLLIGKLADRKAPPGPTEVAVFDRLSLRMGPRLSSPSAIVRKDHKPFL